MKLKLSLGLCIVFLLVLTPMYAASTAQEVTSVSRMVGESPEALINQLDTEELNLNHASYYRQQRRFDLQEGKVPVVEALKSLFDDKNTTKNWDFNDVDLDEFKPNELLIIEADKGSVENGLKSIQTDMLVDGTTQLTPKNIRHWVSSFSETYPTFVFDSDFAGVAVPNEETFVQPLARYSQIIAPTFLHSREFVKTFICNLGPEKTLGHSFREARNKYYEGIDPSSEDMLGVTLMSYHLYGNPLTKTTTPKYDEHKLKEFCDDLVGEEEAFSSQSLGDGIQASINLDYDLKEKEGFTLIDVGNTRLAPFELALPQVVRSHDLPFTAMVSEVEYSFSNPVLLYVNVPEFQEGFMERSCYKNKQGASVESKIVYKEGKQTVSLFFNPVQVVDCKNGVFKLYQNIEYSLPFVSESPMLIELSHKKEVLPEEEFMLNTDLIRVSLGELEGQLEVLAGNEVVYQEEIQSSPSTSIMLKAPLHEGVVEYTARIIHNNISLAEAFSTLNVRWLEHALDIPERINDQARVVLHVTNHNTEEINVYIKDNLMLHGESIQTGEQERALQPGKHEIELFYDGLQKQDQKYPLQVNLGYKDKQEVITGLIVTNHKPILEAVPDVQARPGDLVQVNITARDRDNDLLAYTLSSPLDESGMWQVPEGTQGEHVTTITVSDGLAQDTKKFIINITPNHAPVLEPLEEIKGVEGEELSVTLFAVDGDGDELSYTVHDPHFVQEESNVFTWHETEAGEYEIMYSVSDGRESVQGSFLVIIEAPLDPCEGITCNDYCTEDFTHSTNGQCVEGQCVYESEKESLSCGFNPDWNVLEEFSDNTREQLFTYQGEESRTTSITLPGKAIVHAATVALSFTEEQESFSTTSMYSTSWSDCRSLQGNSNHYWQHCVEGPANSADGKTAQAGLAYNDNRKSQQIFINGETAWYSVGDYQIEYYCDDLQGDDKDFYYSSNQRIDEFSCHNNGCSGPEMGGGSRTLTITSKRNKYRGEGAILCWANVENRNDRNVAYSTAGFNLPGPVYALECYEHSDCSGPRQVCDTSSRSWDDWKCVIPPACYATDKCGIDRWIGNQTCMGNNIHQEYIINYCANPGTSTAKCTTKIENKLKEECPPEEYCSEGACYPAECSSDQDCFQEEEEVSVLYCGSDNNVYQTVRSHVCNNPRTSNAYCSVNQEEAFVEACGEWQYCSFGECRDHEGILNPQLAVHQKRMWKHEGYFAEEKKVLFTEQVQEELQACQDEACTIPFTVAASSPGSVKLSQLKVYYTLPDPCEGVICTNKCDGTTYLREGMCVEGTCRYQEKQNSPECGFHNNFLQGKVTSADELANATVEVVNLNTDKRTSQQTNTKGEYTIELEPGEYAIRVSKKGYLSQERLVEVYQNVKENFILQPERDSFTKACWTCMDRHNECATTNTCKTREELKTSAQEPCARREGRCGVQKVIPKKVCLAKHRLAYAECYNGKIFNPEQFSCKTKEEWKDQAVQYCKNQCAGLKCGVKKFRVDKHCDIKYTKATVTCYDGRKQQHDGACQSKQAWETALSNQCTNRCEHIELKTFTPKQECIMTP
jgi:hypothetical protein